MKRNILFGTVALLAGSLLAADSNPKDNVTAAAKNLAGKSYSWKTSTENAGGGGTRGAGGGAGGRRGGFGGGPQEGKVSQDGIAMITIGGGQNTTEAFIKGDKVVLKRGDEWQTTEELAANAPQGGGGRGRGGAGMFRNFKAPAARALDLVGHVKELKAEDGLISGDLTEEGAKSLLAFGGRGGGNGPEISGAKGSVKFWTKNGVLSKYETKVQGKMSFNGNEREIDRTTTTEIKDIGSTTITVPAEAKKKLS